MDENYSSGRVWGAYENDKHTKVLSEQLDQLISMAESSALAIDRFQEKLLSIRDSIFKIFFYFYAAAGISFISFIYLVDSAQGFYSKFGQMVLLLAFLLACSLMFRSILQLQTARRRLKNEMNLEHHAQQELISLIDAQMRRLVDSDSLPLNWAVLRIRVRKLERQMDSAH